MESNGKSVSIDGDAINTSSVPVIWGTVGTDAQHTGDDRSFGQSPQSGWVQCWPEPGTPTPPSFRKRGGADVGPTRGTSSRRVFF